MKRQIGIAEILGMVAGVAAAALIHDIAWAVIGGFGARLSGGYEGIGGLLLALVATGLLPAFLAVGLASLPQSRRFRIANATLATFAVVVAELVFGIKTVRSLPSFAVWSMHVATAMTGCLAATWAGKALGRLFKPAAAGTVPAAPLAEEPRASRFLVGLALASVPVVLVNTLASSFITIGAAAGLLLILMELPRVPVVLLFGAALAPLAALWAAFTALRAVVAPGRAGQPAVGLERDRHPALFAMVDEVAGLVGTRAPDRVILHLEPTFFVTQARLALFDGEASGRVLALGMPLLGELDGRELRAVLAHEFAHFSGKDVLYSTKVAPAYRGIGGALAALGKTRVEGGAGAVMAILQLPSLLFLAASHEYFATIDRMLGRSRELRADRIAAGLYGKASLVSSLEKAGATGTLFGRLLGSFPVVDASALFAETASRIASDPEAKARVLGELRADRGDALDTHPSLQAREASLPDLPGTEGGPFDWDPSLLEGEGRRLSELAVARLGLPRPEEAEPEESDPAAPQSGSIEAL